MSDGLKPNIDLIKPVVVKCYLSTFRNEGIEIRRFLYKGLEDPTIDDLKGYVRILYPQLRTEEFELMYLDDDNDKVAFSTDPELDVAWREAIATGQQLRLYIHVR